MGERERAIEGIGVVVGSEGRKLGGEGVVSGRKFVEGVKGCWCEG